MPPVISVQHLQKRYKDVVAVADASFEVAQGEIFGLPPALKKKKQSMKPKPLELSDIFISLLSLRSSKKSFYPS